MAAETTSEQPKAFDASARVRKIRTRQGPTDYLDVRYRVMWLRSEHPDASIITEAIYANNDEACMKATISYAIGERMVMACGHGSETAADFPSGHIEKAECVPLDSHILTRRGWQTCYTALLGEEVLAYDAESDRLCWTPLLNITRHPTMSMAQLVSVRATFTCTPDHSWAVEQWNKTRTLKKACDLTSGDRLIISALAPGGDFPLTPREAAILGWIMTDGTIQYRKRGVYRAAICQSKPETVAEVRELVGAVAREDVTPARARTFPTGKTYECQSQHWFWLPAAETRRLFDKAGITHSEQLPELVTHLTREARQAMLAAMMLADGDKKGNFGKKRKPGVRDAWQILCTLEGIAVGAYTPSSLKKDFPVQRAKRRRTVSAAELTLEQIIPMAAWCPTTAFGTWVMRQWDGRVCITGNTKAIGRACAILGYGTDAASDFDDGEPMDGRGAAREERQARREEPTRMDQRQRQQVDAQHERNSAPASSPPSRLPSTRRPAAPANDEPAQPPADDAVLRDELRELGTRGFDLNRFLTGRNKELDDLTRGELEGILPTARETVRKRVERLSQQS